MTLAEYEELPFNEKEHFFQCPKCGQNGWVYLRTPVTPALLGLDPLWDPLRSDPAFQKLCEEKQP